MTNPTKIEHCGCKFAYSVTGHGPPVVLIQGVGIHGSGWGPQVDALKSRYRCLTFDNRGIGGSKPLGAPLSIEQMAEDVGVLMDAQEWPSAHIIGHSMGGLIAQHLALTTPERVRSLSLLCTVARGKDVTNLSAGTLLLGVRTRVGTKRMRRHAFLEMVMPAAALVDVDKDALAERLGTLFGHDLAEQPSVALKQLAALGKYDAYERLRELSHVPTLVISATHDRITPATSGRSIAAKLPGARFVEIGEGAHGVTVQCAERINVLLFGHLAHAEERITRTPPHAR